MSKPLQKMEVICFEMFKASITNYRQIHLDYKIDIIYLIMFSTEIYLINEGNCL